MSENSTNVLEVRNLCKYFPIKAGLFSRVVGHVHAVEDVSFDIEEGETIGITFLNPHFYDPKPPEVAASSAETGKKKFSLFGKKGA